ncbi:MAG: hypothetical protein A3A43_03110 [Candidatus Liptonbacteria bacterium RIFCSPLOWO2_01_FULL_56_20]|uniref:Carboxypeptidase regulatory-like domain-containing protein n=1 Tax=Candidatus Liptonbacteria bacterium RIFCSPLOWO2_01_FULL_56_20 TaxID=1798652 RepID=A0A1G2CJ19_9BACT|nr:MAG: hypothetical protein A2681_02220 [Candidatus Liptonbacteria bacterium RIFCSPHIGHO2_01_FULL_56_18b]OGZ01359.1 MAG: hypothetical protein A3A43_03110 [Candidatus Liptonbacteria bacterium RIFCSPLOWO2_01_FULL_56_20]
MNARKGASLVDLIISLGIIALLFGGIVLVYFALTDAVRNVEARSAAAAVLANQVEVIRNLPYASVGTQGGIPPGIIPPQQAAALAGFAFSMDTVIRYIDDPFDGTLGGSPNDTNPADYKIVDIRIRCTTCPSFTPLAYVTTVTPRGLENSSSTGSLFVNVFDAAGASISGASVHIVNASVTPSIDLTDTTNASGVLQFVGVPTSTQSYQVQAGKTGYSSDRNYRPGDPANPNPLNPYATVAAQTVTNVSFVIDRVSRINVNTSGNTCAAQGSQGFTISGAKLIGVNPDVLKYSTSSATGGTGEITLQNIEWDNYSFSLTGASFDLAGTIPLTPVTVNPSSTASVRLIVQPADTPSLLLTVKDAVSGAGITGANVHLSAPGFSETLITGHATISETDWPAGGFSGASEEIDTASTPGSITLRANASSTYATSTPNWLTSNTIDLGGSASSLYRLSWSPVSQPAPAGSESVKVQLAANNDNATWNFIGPDGTSGTYYTNPSSTIVGLNGNRYLRYKVFLSTESDAVTPRFDSVTFEFNSVCVPQFQVLFSGLSPDTYLATVAAAGYAQGTSSIAVVSGSEQASVLLAP